MSDFIDAVLEVMLCFALGVVTVHVITAWF